MKIYTGHKVLLRELLYNFCLIVIYSYCYWTVTFQGSENIAGQSSCFFSECSGNMYSTECSYGILWHRGSTFQRNLFDIKHDIYIYFIARSLTIDFTIDCLKPVYSVNMINVKARGKTLECYSRSPIWNT